MNLAQGGQREARGGGQKGTPTLTLRVRRGAAPEGWGAGPLFTGKRRPWGMRPGDSRAFAPPPFYIGTRSNNRECEVFNTHALMKIKHSNHCISPDSCRAKSIREIIFEIFQTLNKHFKDLKQTVRLSVHEKISKSSPLVGERVCPFDVR